MKQVYHQYSSTYPQVCAAREVPRDRGSTLDKNFVFFQIVDIQHNIWHHHFEESIYAVNFYFTPFMMSFSILSDPFYIPRLFPPFQKTNFNYNSPILHFFVVSYFRGYLWFLGNLAILQRGQLYFSCFWLLGLVLGSQLPGWDTTSLSLFFSLQFLLFSKFALLTGQI